MTYPPSQIRSGIKAYQESLDPSGTPIPAGRFFTPEDIPHLLEAIENAEPDPQLFRIRFRDHTNRHVSESITPAVGVSEQLRQLGREWVTADYLHTKEVTIIITPTEGHYDDAS